MRLYLVCETCGEAWDDLYIAAEHECASTDEPTYMIQTEENAF
jgi:hypothetical protein